MKTTYALSACLLLLLYAPTESRSQTAISDFSQIHLFRDFAAARATTPKTVLDLAVRNDFCTKELMLKELAFSWNKNQNCLLVSASHYGYKHYGTLAASAGYGRMFGRKFSVAMRIFYLLQHATHYPSRHSVTIDLSSCWQITPATSLAVMIYNPIGLHYGIIGNELIPMTFAVQLHYMPTARLAGTLTTSKTIPGKFNIRIGLAYFASPHLYLNGYCDLAQCRIELHVPWRNLVFSLGTAWFYHTGFSPQGFLYFFI